MALSDAVRSPRWALIYAMGALLVLLLVTGSWLGLSLAVIGYVLSASLYVCFRQARERQQGDPARTRLVIAVTTAVGVMSLAMVTIVPPLQSPDENSHLQRAYSLLDGQFLIRKNSKGDPENQAVDPGLRSYIEIWLQQLASKPDGKVTSQLESATRRTDFSGRQADVFNGAAAYFPVLYAPAATGMGLARLGQQPVWIAVNWARIAMWCVGLIACALALTVTRWGLYTIAAVTALPMTLAQLGSANMDAMTISFGLLALGLLSCGLMGGQQGGRAWPAWVRAGAWLLVALLVLTKPVFVVLLGAPLAWGFYRRQDRINLLWVGFIVLFVGLWTLHTAQNFVDIRVIKPQSSMEMLRGALASPLDTLLLMVETVRVKFDFYWRTMVGVLGWIDTPLTERTYTFSAVLLATALLADAASPNDAARLDRAWFLIAFAGYVVLTLLVMLAAWAPVTNGVIEGVQGRYFLPVLPLIAASFGLRTRRFARWGHWLFVPVLITYLAFLMSELPRILIYRFWL